MLHLLQQSETCDLRSGHIQRRNIRRRCNWHDSCNTSWQGNGLRSKGVSATRTIRNLFTRSVPDSDWITMPPLLVSSDVAVRIRRNAGSSVTFINQSNVDVYFDIEPMRLNSTAPGVTPNGTKLAANGGEKEVDNFPGSMWFRAVSSTSIEVQP